jgi:hypothetical protein
MRSDDTPAASMHTACFSPDRRYRYWLSRDTLPIGGRGTLNMILLNPSTADETQDDPTIRRCIGYARSWSYSRLVITNLFAFRSTDPKALVRADDPIGPDNDGHIRAQATLADRVVIGWGAYGHLLDRGAQVLEILRLIGIRPFCLTRTNGGQPGHPLYLPKDLAAVPFEHQVPAGSVSR